MWEPNETSSERERDVCVFFFSQIEIQKQIETFARHHARCTTLMICTIYIYSFSCGYDNVAALNRLAKARIRSGDVLYIFKPIYTHTCVVLGAHWW